MINLECKTVSVEQAGKILGFGRVKSYRMANDGTLPVIRHGEKMRVSLPALEEMLKTAGKQQTMGGN